MEKQPQKQAEEQPELIRETPVYETKPVTEEKAEQLNLFEEPSSETGEESRVQAGSGRYLRHTAGELENSLYIIDQTCCS